MTAIAYAPNGARTSMAEVTKASPPVSSTSTWSWDSLDRLVSSTDANGASVAYTYDLRGAVDTITYPGGTRTVDRDYDDAGRWRAVTDWAGNTTTFGYDDDNNLTTRAAPAATGVVDSFGYDNPGRLRSVSVAKGAGPLASFAYGRDGAGQVTSVASTGVPADDHSFGYTKLDQLASDSAATDAYRYDPADNLTQFANGTVQAFDAAHQLTAAAGISVLGAAGAANATTSSLSVALPPGVAANDQIVVAATVPGSKKATTPSGYTSVGSWASGTKAANAKVQVFRRTAGGGEASVTVSFGQAYAKALNVVVYRGVHPTSPVDAGPQAATANAATSVTAPSVTTTAMADRVVMAMGATSAPSAGTWTPPASMTRRGAQQAAGAAATAAIADTVVPAAGATGTQRASFSATANLVGVVFALKPATTTSYAYDTRGNRTTGPGGTTLGYDQANRLTSAGTSTYGYDGTGLRLRKTVGGTTTTFAWDQSGGLPLLLSDGSTSYVYGPGGLPLEQVSSTGTVLHYHHDQLGSTRALTNASGAVVASFTYDPYGRLAAKTGTATTPLGFAGQYTDAETGFQYLRARYYDPAMGQFLTRDPLEALTREAYGYAAGNPINLTDPSGLAPWDGWGDTIRGAWSDFKCGAAIFAQRFDSGLDRLGEAMGTGFAFLRAHPGLPQFLVNVAAGFAAGTLAAAVCTSTLGFGCVLLAGAAFGGGLGTLGHLASALALGEEVTVENSITWLQQSLWAGGTGGFLRGATGRGAVGLLIRGAKQGSTGLRAFLRQGFWG